MWLDILQDAFFAAIAAIGFAAISRPPRSAYLFCAIIAAAGHSARMMLMLDTWMGLHIVVATLLASFLVGTLAVFFSPVAKTPAETCLFPSLLPMIPGVYAYRCFGGLAMCMLSKTPENFERYFYLCVSNGLTCAFILIAMVVGATVPIYIFKNISFQATR